jgi:hypothetical protein
MARWNVNLETRVIDTVSFADGMTADDVKKSLVEHDGLNPAIIVTLAPKAKRSAFTVVGYYDDSTQLFTDWVEATDVADAFAQSKAKTTNDGDLVFVGVIAGHCVVTPPCEDSGKVCSAEDIPGDFLSNEDDAEGVVTKCCSCGGLDLQGVSGRERNTGNLATHIVCQECGCHMDEETGEEVLCF